MILFLLLVVGALSSGAQSPQTLIRFSRGLIVQSAPGSSEAIGARDPVIASLVEGRWQPPHAGDVLRLSDSLKSVWEEVVADSAGWFDHRWLSGAYLYCELNLRDPGVFLLEPMGNSIAFVNGEPRVGNPYGLKDHWESWEPHFDYTMLPVRLRAGKNWFLFRCRGGKFKATLRKMEVPLMLNPYDCTLPDLISHEAFEGLGSLVVINGTEAPLEGGELTSRVKGEMEVVSPLPLIQPMSVRKIPFRLASPSQEGTGTVALHLELKLGKMLVDSASLTLRVVGVHDVRKETFRSVIDGSVQYYALLPASGGDGRAPRALILSLHGASVEAINQASAYAAKSWAMVVCPTNRRPYGFDWEGWGRKDALEVLDRVKRKFAVDTNRVYLSGHSMGGHGVYHLGTLFPDRFGAIGASAGWASFWSYGVLRRVEHPSAFREMLLSAELPSDTYAFLANLSGLGVYLLHGSEDDNVPVAESRLMASRLDSLHQDFIYHEQPGVGHWWDQSDEPGTDCVDWAPMLDFFARHARPAEGWVRAIHFATPSPGVSSSFAWASIEAQIHQLKVSRIDIRRDPQRRRVIGVTENVRRLSLSGSVFGPGGPIKVELDGQSFSGAPLEADGRLHLERIDGTWIAGGRPSAGLKSPERSGTFGEVIGHRVLFVYGTKGSEGENAWAFAKSRFDAEQFWYRGNGSIEVRADSQVAPSDLLERNVLLYGNSSTNGLWKELLSDSPVQLGPDSVRVAGRCYRGRDISCLLVRPRAGSEAFSVGVVGGTGLAGMRGTDAMPYFLPGVGVPDLVLIRGEGRGEEGAIGAGMFGDDWSVQGGEFAWGAERRGAGRPLRSGGSTSSDKEAGEEK